MIVYATFCIDLPHITTVDATPHRLASTRNNGAQIRSVLFVAAWSRLLARTYIA